MGTDLLPLCDSAMIGALPVRPRCYNRPPADPVRIRHGISESTGEPVVVEIRGDWFTDRCATWDGVGIGQPTAEYPAGTPYPLAHGWDCRGCRWLPDHVRAGWTDPGAGNMLPSHEHTLPIADEPG